MNALAVALVVYVVALFGVALYSRGKVESAEDYLVAGRRLGLPLASATLLATWFGAGTLLTASEEIRAGGAVRARCNPSADPVATVEGNPRFREGTREAGKGRTSRGEVLSASHCCGSIQSGRTRRA